ncbi:MAG: zinc ABC transporter substrate-binding protein [Clostridia bacterium]|jgi:zinc transport system substrate-binding protein|nr:zinc ABC transporter substrate-binding protein [Clostridia bacterium]MCI9413107.1 zinc ABC transporter substrate-binding protein [Clostridia bacterium]
MKKKISITILVIVVMIIAICVMGNMIGKSQENNNGQFRIVTTFYPIFIMTSNITQGAQNIELVNMADMNAGCLHDYTLSTTDMKKLEKADVIVQNGLGLENFMDKIWNTYSEIKVIDSSKNITSKIEENGEANNHIWTSLSNYIIQVEEIANRLSQINPENEEVYKRNKESYIKQLKELQERYQTELTNLKGKKAVCLNEAFSYLAKEVGLEIISIETNHEESSLSAEKMKELIEIMKKENIKSILVDKEDNLKSAQTLANETGAKIYELQSGLTGDGSNDSYLHIMKNNLMTLKEIL